MLGNRKPDIDCSIPGFLDLITIMSIYLTDDGNLQHLAAKC